MLNANPFKIFCWLLLLAACHSPLAPLPHGGKSETGETVALSTKHHVAVQRYCAGPPIAGVLFYQPHENEATARRVTLDVLAERGQGCLLMLSHDGRRQIHFEAAGRPARFDPNRIYTAAGRAATLAQGGNRSEAAQETTAAFADYLLKHHLRRATFIVAVHNNRSGGTDIGSYTRGALAEDTAAVFINPAHSPDDYFYTTDEAAFAYFKSRGFNVMLQNNHRVRDDGSLSVYAARHNIGYINVEARHGHAAEQREMLQALLDYLDGGTWRR